MMEGENFQIHCCQVSSEYVGCLSALFHVPFSSHVLKLYIQNINSKKKHTVTEIMILCSYVSEEHVASIFRVTGTLR